jgi:hypothetical protein
MTLGRKSEKHFYVKVSSLKIISIFIESQVLSLDLNSSLQLSLTTRVKRKGNYDIGIVAEYRPEREDPGRDHDGSTAQCKHFPESFP